jgi:hypothetical protein
MKNNEIVKINKREKGQSVKSWHAIVLVSSSKLICVECWKSSNIVQYFNCPTYFLYVMTIR